MAAFVRGASLAAVVLHQVGVHASPECKRFDQIYDDGKDLCETMWGTAFKYETNEAPGPESDNFTACHPWKNNACCAGGTVETLSKIRDTYGPEFRWDRCGPMSQECERFFVQESCLYECDPNAGLYRKYNSTVYDPRCDKDATMYDANYSKANSCSMNTWEMHRMPIKASYCDAWYTACRKDHFCASAEGDYFSCAAEYKVLDKAAELKDQLNSTMIEMARLQDIVAQSSNGEPEGALSSGAIAGIVVPSLVAIAGFVCSCYLIRREKMGKPLFDQLKDDREQSGGAGQSYGVGQAGRTVISSSLEGCGLQDGYERHTTAQRDFYVDQILFTCPLSALAIARWLKHGYRGILMQHMHGLHIIGSGHAGLSVGTRVPVQAWAAATKGTGNSPVPTSAANAAGQEGSKEPARLMRPVATPLRAEESNAAAWDCKWALKLCRDGEEARFTGKARLLDRHIVTSVRDAIDSLNRRLVFCPEEMCIVFDAAERIYYLLYRSGRREQALARLGLPSPAEEGSTVTIAAAVVSGNGGGSTMVAAAPERNSRAWIGFGRQESRGGSAGSSVVALAVGRPSLVATPYVAEVARQSSFANAAAIQGQPHVLAEEKSPTSNLALVRAKPPFPPTVAGTNQTHSWVPAPTGCLGGLPSTDAGAARYASPAPRTGSRATVAQSYQPPVPPPEVPSRRPLAANRLWQAPAAFADARATLHGVHAPQATKAKGTFNAGHRLSTPREALERDLTEPEKVRFSDLDFVERLGQGEFGEVFRGRYRSEEVAIKQLFFDENMTELVIQDLAREIESFRHLNHKNLVRFIGASLELPHLCLITEYMPGGSLHHLLHVRKTRLPLYHAMNMSLQMADGVTYLHAQSPKVVHRDLKSLNVVLGLNLNIKICDFGLTESMERTHITKKNNGGSPRYMAPELFDCKTKITEKIDVWAMGCIFVEICGGPLPYEDVSTLGDLTKEMLVHRRTPAVPSFIHDAMRRVCIRHRSVDRAEPRMQQWPCPYWLGATLRFGAAFVSKFNYNRACCGH
ncbi:unnamed protein product [Polarella glacialis]|uniref:Protein kinase domain-containing protein n=1 Tax=Polarella glacialis TaxID=89957 RepID=A0A813DJ93_POLGL|nr:unnamed protein product [Polarella glacialis]